jgi:hypothetical protein
MHDLIHAADGPRWNGSEKEKESEMYSFVMDQLGKLEDRILECVVEAEQQSTSASALEGGGEREEKDGGWTIVPRGLRGRTDIAMSWLPVRGKALELVRQRDALGSRVLFAQMSLISSYVPLHSLHVMEGCELMGVYFRSVRDQEARSRKREERQRERMDRLENLVYAQHEKLDRLEDLVYRVMHRDRVAREFQEDEATVTHASGYNNTQKEDLDAGSRLYPIPST